MAFTHHDVLQNRPELANVGGRHSVYLIEGQQHLAAVRFSELGQAGQVVAEVDTGFCSARRRGARVGFPRCAQLDASAECGSTDLQAGEAPPRLDIGSFGFESGACPQHSEVYRAQQVAVGAGQ